MLLSGVGVLAPETVDVPSRSVVNFDPSARVPAGMPTQSSCVPRATRPWSRRRSSTRAAPPPPPVRPRARGSGPRRVPDACQLGGARGEPRVAPADRGAAGLHRRRRQQPEERARDRGRAGKVRPGSTSTSGASTPTRCSWCRPTVRSWSDARRTPAGSRSHSASRSGSDVVTRLVIAAALVVVVLVVALVARRRRVPAPPPRSVYRCPASSTRATSPVRRRHGSSRTSGRGPATSVRASHRRSPCSSRPRSPPARSRPPTTATSTPATRSRRSR